ncbi:site-specific integrase [Vibrio coralliilyticus]|uniref:tyrosine-type recombinase/integrase n=1 Tax=Vibrio TaxID=662 RepID=UPI0005044B96|nr:MULTISPECIES: site-specific integrase [Vibrio]KFI09473.1 hypothetical protein IX95_24030 [Vibrio sp. B183]NOI21133.1 site-specific integrase [Vibrio coralliilyticus]
MSILIHSSSVCSEPHISFNGAGDFSVHNQGQDLGSLPTLYDEHGHFVHVANAWFFDLKTVKRLKSLTSSSKAILSYWRFLEERQLVWDHFPPINRLKPTYQYRNRLLSLVEDKRLAYSTASSYMNHVVQFYRWAIHEGYLEVKNEKQAPFQIEYTTINRTDKLAHLRPKFSIQTSDLRIKVPKQASSSQSLSPLNRDELTIVASALKKTSIEFQLQCRLALQTGLRIDEVCSLTLKSLERARPITETGVRFEVPIGPSMGIRTKFSKERNIEMVASLLMSLRNYAISERRLRRLQKLNRKEGSHFAEPLFISEQGNPLQPKVLGVRWCELRKNIQHTMPEFNHKFHDLRSTYGTFRLNDLLNSGLGNSEALDCLMGWMGHNHESTTWKYIRFLRRQAVLSEKFAMLDTIMHNALDDCEVPR